MNLRSVFNNRKVFYLIASLLVVSLFTNYLVLKLLAHMDYSEFHLSQTKQGTANATFQKNPYNTFLISYADGPEVFFANQKTLAVSGMNNGINKIINYRLEDLSEEFKSKNKAILEIKQGAGLWLWKPYIILKTLEMVPEGSLVVYSDSGFAFVKDPIWLLEKADKHKMLLVYYHSLTDYGTLTNIVNQNMLQKTNSDHPACKKSPHMWAAFGIYKNTPEVRDFVRQWLAWCEQKELINGENPTGLLESLEFRNHQHDESLLSVTQCQNNFGQYLLPENILHEHVVFFHRKITDKNYATSILPLILRDQNKIFNGFERDWYNSKLLSWIRKSLI